MAEDRAVLVGVRLPKPKRTEMPLAAEAMRSTCRQIRSGRTHRGVSLPAKPSTRTAMTPDALGLTLSGVQRSDDRATEANSLAGNPTVIRPDEVQNGRAGANSGFCCRRVYGATTVGRHPSRANGPTSALRRKGPGCDQAQSGVESLPGACAPGRLRALLPMPHPPPCSFKVSCSKAARAPLCAWPLLLAYRRDQSTSLSARSRAREPPEQAAPQRASERQSASERRPVAHRREPGSRTQGRTHVDGC
jgi:hypothetical protein